MSAGPANVAASIRQRLLNLAKERGEDFEQILVRYALERLLYRLSLSSHADRFVLKGALLFRLWFDLQQRPTRDADFLGFGSAEPDDIKATFRELASVRADVDDGLLFVPETVRAEAIRHAAGYPGVRVTLQAALQRTRIPVQCDIGFGDAVHRPRTGRLIPRCWKCLRPLCGYIPWKRWWLRNWKPWWYWQVSIRE